LLAKASDPRVLQATLKSAGVRALGHRQQIATLLLSLSAASAGGTQKGGDPGAILMEESGGVKDKGKAARGGTKVEVGDVTAEGGGMYVESVCVNIGGEAVMTEDGGVKVGRGGLNTEMGDVHVGRSGAGGAALQLQGRGELELPLHGSAENEGSMLDENDELILEENGESSLDENAELILQENSELILEDNGEFILEANVEVLSDGNGELVLEENEQICLEQNKELAPGGAKELTMPPRTRQFQLGVTRREWTPEALRVEMEVGLITPPRLPETRRDSSSPTDPIDALRKAGTNGSQRFQRHQVVERLLQLDRVAGGNVEMVRIQRARPPIDKERAQEVLDLCSSLHLCCQSPRLLDERYREGFAAACKLAGAPIAPACLASGIGGGGLSLDSLLGMGESRRARVCVLGVGSGVCALSAARGGGQVVWMERLASGVAMCEALVKKNGLEKRVHVVATESWEQAEWPQMERFDTVVSEEWGEDPLSDGLLHTCRVARRALLTKEGSMLPARLRLWGALGSVRTKEVSGLDLRGLNALRSEGAAVYDAEEVFLSEPGCAALLGPPLLLMEINLNHPPPPEHSETRAITTHACKEGIFNCLISWLEIEMPSGDTISFAPREGGACRHMYYRALRQRLHFVGFEQRVGVGQCVQLSFRSEESSFSFSAPPDQTAAKAGLLSQWKLAPSLSYHFAMVAERERNDKFERPLLSAIRAFTLRHGGRRPHVLDIGSGSGLLAMMAARGGAGKVSSVEVVPQMAAAARYIVDANGWSNVVTIHTMRSDELPVEKIGGRADILVSELIDDHLIGDGILAAHQDARRRLLAPDAAIIPWGGKIYALPLQVRLPSPSGIDITPLHLSRCQQVILSYPYASDKMQRSPPGYHTPLAPPVHLFDFDWAKGPLETLCDERTTNEIPLVFTKAGTFNAVALLFTLGMDDDRENDYSDFLENTQTHWDQPVRFLPRELRVNKGDTLTMVASHNDNDIHRIKISGIKKAMAMGQL
ncbi:MAG: hypothetical protein SGPRY_013289, partial [Prymnesium sp.]